MFFTARTKPSQILIVFALGVVLMLFSVAIQRYLQTDRIEGIAQELRSRYGLVILYGNPSEFHVPPLLAINNKLVTIRRANKSYVLNALEGIKAALKLYPPALVRKYLSAIFIAGTIKIFGVVGAATYYNSWIYISTPRSDQLGPESYALSVHHELSSLFLKGAPFPDKQWMAINLPDFGYLKRRIDIVRAAAVENRRDSKEAKKWYQDGFVSDYGMTSMENDVNTYAELAMGEPGKLVELAKIYPKIAKKSKILVKFYCSLAPGMNQYFKSVGLLDDRKESR